jgi:hypothetical protein
MEVFLRKLTGFPMLSLATKIIGFGGERGVSSGRKLRPPQKNLKFSWTKLYAFIEHGAMIAASALNSL